ncbi:MAG: hypothetical protein ACREBD_21240, partial [Blastocatellia bacterium]
MIKANRLLGIGAPIFGTQEAEKWRAEKYARPDSITIFLPLIFLLSSFGNRKQKNGGQKNVFSQAPLLFFCHLFFCFH